MCCIFPHLCCPFVVPLVFLSRLFCLFCCLVSYHLVYLRLFFLSCILSRCCLIIDAVIDIFVSYSASIYFLFCHLLVYYTRLSPCVLYQVFLVSFMAPSCPFRVSFLSLASLLWSPWGHFFCPVHDTFMTRSCHFHVARGFASFLSFRVSIFCVFLSISSRLLGEMNQKPVHFCLHFSLSPHPSLPSLQNLVLTLVPAHTAFSAKRLTHLDRN